MANADLACGVLFCRYLGLYKDEIEAAIAYDKEAVRGRGIYAVTNFDLAEYIDLLGMLPKSTLRCCCGLWCTEVACVHMLLSGC